MYKRQDKIIDEAMAASLVDFGNMIDVDVFFSVCYPEAIPMCERIGVKYYKVRYADRDNHHIMGKVIDTGKPWFRSCNGDDYFTMNMNVINLFCRADYPAELIHYPMILPRAFKGYSDHTPSLTLLKHCILNDYDIEIHVKEDDNCLESKWSKKIGDIKECLN